MCLNCLSCVICCRWCCAPSDRHIDSQIPTLLTEHHALKLVDSLQTGDLLLHRKARFSPFIQRGINGSHFDHVSLVIRREPRELSQERHIGSDVPRRKRSRRTDGRKTCCAATGGRIEHSKHRRCDAAYCNCNGATALPIELLESTKAGVHIYGFLERLVRRRRVDRCVVVRRLERPLTPAQQERVFEIVDQVLGLPYVQGSWVAIRAALLEASAQTAVPEHLQLPSEAPDVRATVDSGTFCSQLVGLVLVHAGLLPKEVIEPALMLPSDFTSANLDKKGGIVDIAGFRQRQRSDVIGLQFDDLPCCKDHDEGTHGRDVEGNMQGSLREAQLAPPVSNRARQELRAIYRPEIVLIRRIRGKRDAESGRFVRTSLPVKVCADCTGLCSGGRLTPRTPYAEIAERLYEQWHEERQQVSKKSEPAGLAGTRSYDRLANEHKFVSLRRMTSQHAIERAVSLQNIVPEPESELASTLDTVVSSEVLSYASADAPNYSDDDAVAADRCKPVANP
jgi:hypothetical protein